MNPAIFGEDKVDCHCHILDPTGFPYAADVAYRPAGQETGTADYFAQVLEAYGVKHALLVGPNSGYGTDNRCLLDAIGRHGNRFKGVAVVAKDTSAAQLSEFKEQGIIGIAFNYALFGTDYYRDAPPLMERIASENLFVQIQVCEDQLVTIAPEVLGSGAQILVDHCGRPDLARGVSGAGFASLLRAAESKRVTVKLSGFAKFSAVDCPFPDTRAFVSALLEAFGPDHCVWASDWPFLKAPRRLDYGTLLQVLARSVPDAADRKSILWTTPRRLFQFD